MVLVWAAYKANLLPKSYFPPPNIRFEVEGTEIKYAKTETSKTFKAISFGLFSVLVVIGFIFVVLDKLVISIFILGLSIVALFIMTGASFVFLIKDLWFTLTKVVRANNKKCKY